MTMRKVLFVCVLLLTIAATRAYGCDCGCAWVCDDRCQIHCDGCTLTEAMNQTEACCAAAHQATGDLGPCGGGELN